VTFANGGQEQERRTGTQDDNLMQQKYHGTNAIMNSMHKYAASRRFMQLDDAKSRPVKNPLV